MVMKKLISVLLTISIAAVALAQPQGRPGQKGHKPDFEKMKAERGRAAQKSSQKTRNALKRTF